MTRQSHMERKIPRDRKHPQSSNKRAIEKGPIQAAPSEVKPKPPATPPPSQAHLHSAEEACHCQLIQKLMTWITVLPLRGSHSFEEKQLFPDGSLGKALFKGSPQQWLGSHTWKGRSTETESILSHPIKGQSKKAPSRQHHQRQSHRHHHLHRPTCIQQKKHVTSSGIAYQMGL